MRTKHNQARKAQAMTRHLTICIDVAITTQETQTGVACSEDITMSQTMSVGQKMDLGSKTDESLTFAVSYSKMDYFFQSKPEVKVDQLKITNVGLYSVTPWKEADLISGWIRQFFIGPQAIFQLDSQLLSITDATANVGGNTISFHLNGFDLVHSVEKDQLTAKLLIENLQQYQLPTHNVHCCDYLSMWQQLHQQVVFFDPPWGGPDYKKKKNLDLYLSGVNIIQICQQLLQEKRTNLLVLKIPVNYNMDNFRTQMFGYHYLIRKVYRYKHHSYNILFCW